MYIKGIISAAVVAVCVSTPMIASAKVFGPSLTIVNNTNHDSTTIINNGLCSSKILGASGVTKAHSTNVVSGAQLALACIKNANSCSADVYMTNNCSGPKVANVVFSTSTGIKTFTVIDNAYRMQGSGFMAQIDGGPDLAN